MARRQAGFTLLELLVAFTVLVLAFTVTLRVFSSGVRGVTRAEAHSAAVEQARARLAAAAQLRPLRPGRIAGTDTRGHRWALRIEPADDGLAPEQGLALLRLTATVEWGDPERPRSLSLWTLRLVEHVPAGLDAPAPRTTDRRPALAAVRP